MVSRRRRLLCRGMERPMRSNPGLFNGLLRLRQNALPTFSCCYKVGEEGTCSALTATSGALCRKLTFLLRIEVWFVERSEAPNRNGQKPYPAKMRRLRLLVVLSSILIQAKQIGTPGKAKDEPCRVHH
jgi:hypothetical protein